MKDAVVREGTPVPGELLVLWKLQFSAENPQKVPSKFLFLLHP